MDKGEQMKRAPLTALSLVALAVGVVPPLGAGDAVESKGRVAFDENKCVMCHGVTAEDLKPKAKSPKMLGPDLSGFTSEIEFPRMAAFLRGEETVKGARHRKPFKGTDEELQAILDWLGSLEVQE